MIHRTDQFDEQINFAAEKTKHTNIYILSDTEELMEIN
jgi:hypothetical protein